VSHDARELSAPVAGMTAPRIPPELWDDNAPLPAWLVAGMKLAFQLLPSAYEIPLCAEQESLAMLQWAARPPVKRMSLRERAIYETVILTSPNLG
jgi:hypothetical protein